MLKHLLNSGQHLLVLVRHGQSAYNFNNLFTGSADCDLSPIGKIEAKTVGEELKAYGLHFDQAYCSCLKRTLETFNIIVETVKEDFTALPVKQIPALNERNYGLLQGKNKEQASLEYGADQVELWRRGYAAIPPGGESLEQTAVRVIGFFTTIVVPVLQSGKRVLIIAHGNTLRSLMMHLENLSPAQVEALEVITGQVTTYILDKQLNIFKKEIYTPV